MNSVHYLYEWALSVRQSTFCMKRREELVLYSGTLSSYGLFEYCEKIFPFYSCQIVLSDFPLKLSVEQKGIFEVRLIASG
jgi:hypothetical protein